MNSAICSVEVQNSQATHKKYHAQIQKVLSEGSSSDVFLGRFLYL